MDRKKPLNTEGGTREAQSSVGTSCEGRGTLQGREPMANGAQGRVTEL
jgi:hypothetical protein